MSEENNYTLPSDNEQNNGVNEAQNIPEPQVPVQNEVESIPEPQAPVQETVSEPKSFDAQEYIEKQAAQAQTNEQNIPGSQGMYYSYSPNNYRGQYNESQQNYQFYNQNQKPPKKKRTGVKITLAVLGIIAVVTAAGLFGFWTVTELREIFSNKLGINSSSSNTSSETQSFDELVINSKPAGADEYTANSDGTLTAAAVIAKVRPSIVGIVQYTNTNGIPTMAGQGSGIIISEDGFIVTNAHVVEGASMITVVLDNEEEYRATLKGLDTQSDLAVIKIEATGLPAAELGNSSETVVGESVIAIGNPGGLELAGSCTGGMVSGLDRTITSSSGYAVSYIQTDAAINPGNSGGALVNMYGQVIGINSAKITSEGYENLGFAIPINEAIPIIGDLQQYGYVKNRAKIGISFQLITETVSQYYNYSIPAGLLVTEIDESCDIARSDVEINDIITEIDGQKITSANVIYTVLQNKAPGDTVELTVYRIGTRMSTSKTFTVTVTLAEDKGTTEQ